MAENELRNMIIGFILFSLFGVLIIGALVSVAPTYGKDANAVTGNSMDLSRFNSTVSRIQGDSQALESRFRSGNVIYVFGGIVIGGIFQLALDMGNFILLPFVLIKGIMENVFYIPSIVSDVILGIITISMIFMIWRLVRTGS